MTETHDTDTDTVTSISVNDNVIINSYVSAIHQTPTRSSHTTEMTIQAKDTPKTHQRHRHNDTDTKTQTQRHRHIHIHISQRQRPYRLIYECNLLDITTPFPYRSNNHTDQRHRQKDIDTVTSISVDDNVTIDSHMSAIH